MPKLPNGHYYEAEMQASGICKDGEGQTIDDQDWKDDKQSSWNIWVVLRDDTNHTSEEVLDLDIPVDLGSLADTIFIAIEDKIAQCNRLGIVLD